MPTTIPLVTVSRTEAGAFLIRCQGCPNFHTLRASRLDADQAATLHQASHATPDPADQVSD